MALTRITITVPAELVRAADKAAKAQDRSRSWVVADALRRGLAHAGGAAIAAPGIAAVREVPRFRYAPDGLDPQRFDQLRADMALTAEQRVMEAEETLRTGGAQRPGPRSRYVRFFERFEDYLAWNRAGAPA
jgi:hypothetical protein